MKARQTEKMRGAMKKCAAHNVNCYHSKRVPKHNADTTKKHAVSADAAGRSLWGYSLPDTKLRRKVKLGSWFVFLAVLGDRHTKQWDTRVEI